jgi:plastocyanin
MTVGRQQLFPFLVVVTALLVLLVVSGPASAAPTRVRAVADEYSLALSRASVPNKRVRIVFVNKGAIAHNLRLRKRGGGPTYTVPLTQAGDRRKRTFRLRPGRYNVWCSVGSHRVLGMETTLRVRR